ncbi:MAG: aminoacyl-tRNA deacylase [Thermomicrobiales bacterium]
MTSEAADRLVQRLRELNVAAEVIAPGVPMPTVASAATAAGVPERAIVKSLLFTDRNGGLVMAVANGTGRVDRHRLAQSVGSGPLAMAKAATVLRATGYVAGGVAPVLPAEPFPVVIDTKVMTETVVYCGGGSEDVLLRISPADIARLSGAIVADIAIGPTA